mmetsp:Transcript_13538/g.31158  ORF Transcript_13538/g.31158 Transcript_13538/m.31158 type:complete len:350 (-) Transcript_13538:33-1082(-)
MAKIGEGDPRWIVKDRADGANVNAWHWEEKNCRESFKSKLTSVISEQTVYDGPEGKVVFKTVEQVEGEICINQRKGRRFLFYDLENIKVAWEASLGDATAKGSFLIPEVDSVNGVESSYVIETKLGSEKASVAALNELGKTQGTIALRKFLLDTIRDIEATVAQGAPKPAAAAPSALAAESKASDAQLAQQLASKQAAQVAKTSRSGTGTITITENFQCRPCDLFVCFTDPQRVSAFTGSRSVVSASEGTPFSMYDGNISGENVTVVQDQQLVQKWRLRGWAEGHFSTVDMSFEASEGGCKFTLKQTNVPEQDAHGNDGQVNVTEDGWRRNILNRIKMVFGFGSGRPTD